MTWSAAVAAPSVPTLELWALWQQLQGSWQLFWPSTVPVLYGWVCFPSGQCLQRWASPAAGYQVEVGAAPLGNTQGCVSGPAGWRRCWIWALWWCCSLQPSLVILVSLSVHSVLLSLVIVSSLKGVHKEWSVAYTLHAQRHRLGKGRAPLLSHVWERLLVFLGRVPWWPAGSWAGSYLCSGRGKHFMASESRVWSPAPGGYCSPWASILLPPGPDKVFVISLGDGLDWETEVISYFGTSLILKHWTT